MIRRLALAGLIALFPAIASAQVAFIAPTPPPGDNSDKIANTQWVNQFLGGSLPLANGQLFIGSAGGVATPQTPSGDWTISNAGAATLATVNANVGTFGSATTCITTTQNAKGLTTALSAATCTPAIGSITGLGTGIATALGVNTGSAGAPVLFNSALGTPSSGVGTNLTALSATNVTSGNLPDAQMPNTAWSAFTPSLTCGTATFTTNSARFKTWGKVTHIQSDFTITAIGTCTTPVQFTLPNTPNSSGSMSGQEIAVTAKGADCFIQSGSTTTGCRMADNANWLVNYRLAASGIYENQ